MADSDSDEPVSVYDEVEIEDMTLDETLQIYHYPCPCGDRFEIAIADLRDGADIAVCPSCSLMIRVIFEVVSFVPLGSFLEGRDVHARKRGCEMAIELAGWGLPW